MDQMETKVQELHQETLPPVPENTTATSPQDVDDADRRTLAAVLERQIREAGDA